MKAKALAVKLSGELGKEISKMGAVAGGLALGAATGGAAMLGRNTIGRAAENLSERQFMKDWAAKYKLGGSALKATRAVGKGSFDARGIKVAGKGLADTGLKSVGKAKEGGFNKQRTDYVAGQEKFASSLAMGELERHRRGLAAESGDSDTVIKGKLEKAKGINAKRINKRADTVERGIVGKKSKRIAAIKIREAGANKKKKMEDAFSALAGGGGDKDKGDGKK